MKLARLLLQAFGPFSDTALDFTASPANLHVIYGPNEAGKSCALRAMTDLRFGIHLRSSDDFLHPSNQLRIGGVFIDDQGGSVGLTRRKGRGQTLSRFNAETGQSDPAPVTREDELRLTAGLERGEFEAMFGLNHTRLREGGNLLLKGEGELGSALFEASAGTRGISALLAALDADAKQLYNPHGRAQNATINDARRQFDEHRRTLRDAQTRPADWAGLHRAHEAAKATLDEVTMALENLRRRENELTELRSVEPLLREHDRTLAELESLADTPDLAENAREERLAAEQAARRAQQDLKDADLELTRCAEELSALVIEQPLLDHAETVERLAAGAEAGARSRVEVQQQQVVIERIEAEIADTAARIAPATDVKAILNAVPSVADRVALDSHLRDTSRLDERLNGFRNRAQELDQATEPEAVDTTGAPDPKSWKAVADALRQAQALGDVGRKLPEHDRELGELNGRLGQALSDLRIATLDALRNARPLLDAEIASNRKSLTDLDEAVRAARDEDVRLERDLEQQQLRRRELEAEGEVVTADTLRLARERRDRGWTAIRQAYVERSRDAEELARAFDPGRPLPEAFETAQHESDRQADLLRADARRAAGFEESTTRIETMDKRRQAIVAELARIGIRREEISAAWSRKLAEAGLPQLDADALREWQAARLGALEIAERLARVQAERDRLHGDISAAITELKAALQAVGQSPQGDSVGSLIEQAAQWERHITEAEADRRARLRAERERKAEKARIDAQIVQTDSELQEHLLAVQASHARLFLPAGSAPETVKARLDELDELTTQAANLREARERQAHHQAVVDDLSHQAARIASVLGEPAPDLITDFAARLRTRLAASREQDQRRIALARDRDRARETKRQAQAELEAQAGTLARLCAAAAVDAAEKLPEREDAAARKRTARSTLAAQRDQLARASKRSEEELRERLAGQDAVAMESELDRCRIEIGEKEGQQASARAAEEQARRALDAIDASDRAAAAREAMESAAARFRGAVRPWARLRLAHALLQEALNRFRERAQAPMVAAASTYFSLMTGGRYVRLEADDEGDKPVLRAVQADGARKGIEAMSDGTTDQLYLALRLAALDLRRASHPRMPLILDDVLITSDDERSANILRALARFAEGSQVMIFTHHQHLIDVARAALGVQTLAIHNL